MSDLPDGGPAFPRIANLSIQQMDGMTMRQWYRGQALIGIAMRALAPAAAAIEADGEYADAMLKEEKARR